MKNINSNKINISEIKIRDVIDIDTLQKFQDNFAKSMNIASITVDINGDPVTKPSSYTRFCMSYTQSTSTGDRRCAESHKTGGEEAARTGKPYVYTCHAGLIDFAAPIMIEGTHIGTILGGQILTSAPTESNFREIAKKIGVDEDSYVEEMKKIKITDKENVEAAAEVLYIMSNSLSKIGYEQLKLSNMSKNLSENLTQVSATMEELAASSINVTSNQHVLNDEISNIKEVSIEINSILTSIRSIADKTNMLGLNAAIEAARAGEAGKGFSVVAQEIRSLSENSKETASQIMKLTSKIQQSVDKTIDSANSTLETTEQQTAAIQEVNANMEEVAVLADELSNSHK
jgi:ligand-binding sensor protein